MPESNPAKHGQTAIVLTPTRPTASNVAITNVTLRSALAIRRTAAIVFVIFGAGKFVNHGSELASFRHYGLPLAGVFVYVIGVLEIAGGLLLARGLLVRAAALVLAGDMVGAIVVSGIGQGEAISLTLAPALLVGMIFLLRTGAIHAGVGRRFAVRRSNRCGQEAI